MTSCQACGSPLPVAARFCPSCGDVVTPGRDTGSRRPVTIVFTDIVGSTALGERLDAETLGGVMTRYYETMRHATVYVPRDSSGSKGTSTASLLPST